MNCAVRSKFTFPGEILLDPHLLGESRERPVGIGLRHELPVDRGVEEPHVEPGHPCLGRLLTAGLEQQYPPAIHLGESPGHHRARRPGADWKEGRQAGMFELASYTPVIYICICKKGVLAECLPTMKS